MEQVFANLAENESGKRFVLNLYWGLKDQSVSIRIGDLIAACTTEGDAEGGPNNHLRRLLWAVRRDPDSYQFQGPSPIDGPARWMTVKSALQLAERAKAGLDQQTYAQVSRFGPETMRTAKDDALCEDFAATLNDLDPEVEFLLSQRHPPNARPAPVWLSRWCTFERDCPETAMSLASAATRVRDWLGLWRYGPDDPLFIIRTRQPMLATELGARRPTILDAIDCDLFKHPTASGRDWAGCGSAADLHTLRQPQSRPVDGGPEVVARSVRFNAREFECVFVGRAGELGYDWKNAEFHRVLLPDDQQVDDVVQFITTKLRRSP